MIRLTGLNEDDIKEISWQIADAGIHICFG